MGMGLGGVPKIQQYLLHLKPNSGGLSLIKAPKGVASIFGTGRGGGREVLATA